MSECEECGSCSNKKIVRVSSCIFAVAWTYEDGTGGCGLTGSGRDCHWCNDYLEQKTRFQEENCKRGRMLGYGWHPYLPNELHCVDEVFYPDGSFAWWDVGVKMYDRLIDAVNEGWDLRFEWWTEDGGYMKDCGLPKGHEDQCCLNRGGMCTLDTADFNEIDRAVGQRGCGFIGVNDRYLNWKYGVPYKDFNCGNCGFYEAGELSQGICTNGQVEPHTKGITANNEKTYIETKECYSGAHACKKFVKRGSEAMPKQKYWTKCGRQFEKNSTATVTGYELPFNEDESHVDGITQEMAESFEKCIGCPFRNKVEDGWPEKKFVRWECRAGSKEPNHKTEWTGSLEDKNTIQIHSLDHQLMEEIIAFCKDHPDLGASYNTDHMADCRRTIAVNCSSNKKGIAAKKELIEKFFPTNTPQVISCRTCVNSEIFKNVNHAGSHGNCHKNGGSYPIYIPDSKCQDFASASEAKDVCGDCGQFTLDTGDANEYGHCDYKNRRMAKDHEACVEFDLKAECPVPNERPACDKQYCPLHSDDKQFCGFIPGDIEADYEIRRFEIRGAVDMHDCERKEVIDAYNGMFGTDKNVKEAPMCETEESLKSSGSDLCANGSTEESAISIADNTTATTAEDSNELKEAKKLTYKEQMQKLLDDATPNATCKHFKGFTYVGIAGQNPAIICDCKQSPIGYAGEKFMLSSPFKNYCCEGKKCEAGGAYEINVPENTAIDITEPSNIVTFDYSTVDADTASFLQEKANRITEIRIKSVIAMGKELKEAQSKLASHDGGTFIAWAESLGLKKSTSYNYINAYNWVVQNLDNIDDAENIQPSLLFAASKPSAPKELSDKVASGDITSHKQYKDLEKKLKDAEDRAERIDRLKSEAVDKAIKAEQDKRKAEKMRDDSIDAFERDLNNLTKQLEQAKRNGDPKKVQELGEKIRGYQDEIKNYQQQIGSLNVQLAEKNKQLKDRPIEVAATRTVEVIPDEIKDAIYRKVAAAYEGLNSLTLAEIKIFAAGVYSEYTVNRSDVIDGIQNAFSILSTIEREILNTNYSAAVEEAAATSEPAGNCGDCIHSNIDKATPEQVDADQTFCENASQVVDLDHSCSNYKACWGGKS